MNQPNKKYAISVVYNQMFFVNASNESEAYVVAEEHFVLPPQLSLSNWHALEVKE